MTAFRLEAPLKDVRYAFRCLARSPGFTAVAVLTLALGIGANTAIFSVVDAVLLDPLAFPEADRLVSIRGSAPGTDRPAEFGLGDEFVIQYGEATRLEDLGYFSSPLQMTVRAGTQVERLFISSVSPSFFSTLGVKPMLGRLPTAEDDDGDVVVISHWLWTTWFGRDPSIVGRPLDVGRGRIVVGVMGPDLRFPLEQTALWVNATRPASVRPGGFSHNLIGRLKPGGAPETLAAELAILARRLPERFGGSPRLRTHHRAASPDRAVARGGAGRRYQRPLWILLGTVGIVLLIACANVANLLAVRAESRIRDLAVRRALGAGRVALIRSQMAEALVLAAAGGAIVLLAWVGVPIGQQLRRPRPGADTPWMTVGGVVEDVMLADSRQQRPEPLVYLPMVGQTARSWVVATPAYVVRTARAKTIGAEIREVIRQVAPEAPMYLVFTVAQLAARSMATLSFTMLTLAIAAGLALILGAVGLYGVLSYVVSQRTREIGIRMALGAQADNVRRLVVARGVGIALVGVGIGLVGAFFLTRALDSLLFGVEALNVVNFVAMSVVMLGVALAASYGPARRASAVDPMVSLRAE